MWKIRSLPECHMYVDDDSVNANFPSKLLPVVQVLDELHKHPQDVWRSVVVLEKPRNVQRVNVSF